MNIEKAFDRAIRDYAMLAGDDRVLIGASGGKDSLTLSYLLARRRDRLPESLRLTAVHVRVAGMPRQSMAFLEETSRTWGIPLEIVEVSEKDDAASASHTLPSCFRCAFLRREALMRRAVELGCGKIALGHHLDDILTTLFMNLVERGNATAMPPLRHYETFGVDLIRPLAYVPEESVRRLANALGWISSSCACPAGIAGERAEYRQRLEILSGGTLKGKMNLFRALVGS